MKTAMQDYIEYLEGVEKRDGIPSWIITTAKNYLEIEKEQIVNSFLEGFCNEGRISSEEFYNKNYGQSR